MTRAVVDDLPSTRPIASYLPAMLQADDFCVRFTRGLDPVLAPVLSTIDNLDAYLDPWLTPPDFLDWLAGWFGLELDATWPEERRRALVANALELGRWRGTVIGLALLVELYTGARPRSTTAARSARRTTRTSRCRDGGRRRVTVRYQPGEAVDVARLERLVRDAVPAHLAVRCEATDAHDDERRPRWASQDGEAMYAQERELAEPKQRADDERQHADHDAAWQAARRAVAVGSVRSVEPKAMLHLQRIAGNSGVGSLVDHDAEDEQSPVLDVVGKGGGSPLPTAVRTDMEAKLGADFGSVRVHDGDAAAASAHAVQAKAYTVGDEIVFNQGAYAPDTPAGQHTLAHELTHVVQQRSGPVAGTPTGDGVAVSDPGDRFEREAESRATEVTAQRQGEEEEEEPEGARGPPRRGDGRRGGARTDRVTWSFCPSDIASSGEI